jgi:endoglucanase
MVSLKEGRQNIKVISSSQLNNNWSLNWIELAPYATPIATGKTTVVEAENYSNMYGVHNEHTLDAGGGQDVSYIDPFDWMDYSIDVPQAGRYNFNFRVSSLNNYSQFQLRAQDGMLLKTIYVPYTGGYQSWNTISAVVNLPAGYQTLRIISSAPLWNNWNLNWFDFTPISNDAVTETTKYTVTVTDNYGCQGTATWNGFAPFTTSVQRNVYNKQLEDMAKPVLKVYPNPSTNSFTFNISCSNMNEKAKLIIRDASGRAIEQKDVLPYQNLQLGSGYRPGLYFAELIQTKSRTSVKLVKLAN